MPLREVLLIDTSDSVELDALYDVQSHSRLWQAADANRFVVAFGQQAHSVPNAGATWPEVDGRASNIGQALTTAQALLGNEPGRIILASDGAATNDEQATEAVSALAAAGHRLDVIPLSATQNSADIWVGTLWAPSLLWEGGSFTALLPVYAPQAGTVTVELVVNGVLRVQREEALQAGANYVPLVVENPALGILTLEANVESASDPRRENNEAYSTTQVFDSPEVLFVSESGLESTFVAGLRTTGVVVESVEPAALPADLQALERYDVVFLDNLLASSLSAEQMLALDLFVSRRGGGLIFLGGSNSYTLGGYNNSLLAPLLPVRMEAPPRLERPPATFVIIFDRSSSMRAPQPDVPAIDLAREAAMRAIEIVDRDDYIGVLTYGNDVHWNAPLAKAGGGLALRQAQDAISQVQANGATAMYKALETVVNELETQRPTDTGLILLLSDGRSSDGRDEEFLQLARRASMVGLSISTIAMGDDHQAADLMAMIAEEGNGRYYRVLNAAELPGIMVEEGRSARGDNVQEGITGLIVGESNHPLLGGINPAGLPVLRSYNALSSRADEGAEDILLSSSFNDPILSGWQYGLGRVVAWMGDSGADWSSSWRSWDGAAYFWSQVVRYALLNPAVGPAQVNVRTTGGVLEAQLSLVDARERPHNWAEPALLYASGEGSAQELALPQVAPGAYSVQTALPEPGAYRAIVRYGEGDTRVEVAAPFAVNYPREWRPVDVEQSHEQLTGWAQVTGGEVVTLEALPSIPSQPAPVVNEEQLLWELLLALVILWPVEIALRRHWLPWT
jgi:uncharacterized membrane protein